MDKIDSLLLASAINNPNSYLSSFGLIIQNRIDLVQAIPDYLIQLNLLRNQQNFTSHFLVRETGVGKNGFEYNKLVIFELKLKWVLQTLCSGSTWECVILHEEMKIIY